MKKTQTSRASRASGDKVVFRGLSMVFGLLVFFVFYSMSQFAVEGHLQALVEAEFWESFGWMVLLCFCADYAGKGLAYGVLLLAYKDRAPSKFAELNEMSLSTFLVHLVEVLLRAGLFLLGAAQVVQASVFADDTLWTLMLTYLLLKIVIAVVARLAAGAIL